jgi:hypothetical protein
MFAHTTIIYHGKYSYNSIKLISPKMDIATKWSFTKRSKGESLEQKKEGTNRLPLLE